MLDSALRYIAAGLSVIPTAPGRKSPIIAWGEFQRRLPTEREARKWWPGRNGLCIICGAVSGGVEAIDFDAGGIDYGPWIERLETSHPGLAAKLVVQRTPSGGMHAVYRCAEPRRNTKIVVREVGGETTCTIETRGEGGLIVAAPTDGYAMVQGDFADLPTLDNREVAAIFAAAESLRPDEPIRPAEEPGPPQKKVSQAAPPPGDAYNAEATASTVLADLTAAGWSIVDETDENYRVRRPGKSEGVSGTIRKSDATFYNFSSNAPGFAPSEAYSPFAVRAILRHRGDYSAAASAIKRESTQTRPPLAANEGADAEPEPLKTYSITQITSEHPSLREPVIEGFLRRGEVCNVIAAPKVRKSWLCADLAIAIAGGRPWLDRVDVSQRRVLLVDNELHAETIASRIEPIMRARGGDGPIVDEYLRIAPVRGLGITLDYFGAIERTIQQHGCGVLILDALYRFIPPGADENSNSDIKDLYNMIDRLADRHGVSIIMVHHTSKGNQSAKSVTDTGSGAGSQSRAADTHIVMREHDEDGCVVMDAACRSWPPPEPVVLRWCYPVWQVADELDPADLKVPEARRPKPRIVGPDGDTMTADQFVRAYVAAEPRPYARVVEAAMGHGMSRADAKRYLDAAEARDLVIVEGTGRRASPRTVRLASSAGLGSDEP